MKYAALIALFVVVQLWTASAAPRAKASAPATTPASGLPSFEEFFSQAQENLKSATEHINEMIGLPKNADATAVFNVIKTNSESFTKEVSEVVEKIKKQLDSAKTGEVSETVKTIQTKLEKTVESFRKELESPDVKAKTKQIQENFTKSLNTLVEEAGKLSKTVATDKTLSEDIQKLSKQVIEQAVKVTDTIQTAIHEATDHKEGAAHKH